VDLASAGLKVPSIIRMKLFTLDHNLVLKRIGYLSEADQESVKQALHGLLSFLQ
jgi:mRNA interferase MazF